MQRSVLPCLTGVRPGDGSDIELLDAIDRSARGAGHGADHEVMIEQYRLIVVEHGASRGYSYLYATGAPYLLAATDVAAAESALWAALAATDATDEIDFDHLTSRHGWAIDIGLGAGLELHGRGYLALRGMAPPAAYLPSGHFL
ncbi:MAG: hypothetical protein H0V07_07265 [Propionibacteriales bacterium]|nr:hypothetical protein [Propionibacteriales bacterium]